MPKQIRYKVVSAIITTLIMASLYTAFNIHLMPFSMVAPPLKTDEQEINIPLDQMMEDMADLMPLPDEKAKKAPPNQVETKEKDASEKKTDPTPAEQDHFLADNQDEAIKNEVSPQEIKKDEVETTPADTLIEKEIQKIIEEQMLAKVASQQKKTNKRSQAERIQFYQKNYKAIRNFLVVYPYAIRTRQVIDSLNVQLALTTNKKEQKILIDRTEKQLFSEYESAVRKMTTSQGRILLKLIARETNKSGYEIIKDFKGGFSATFWFAVGKLFNTDLKTKYDKEKGDSIYEEIIERYEEGEYK